MILGHLQRGGQPTGYDRLLSTRFGGAAVRAIEEQTWGHMVALQSPHIVFVPIAEVLRHEKRRRSGGGHRDDGAGDGHQLRGLRPTAVARGILPAAG